jgi:hypothetical protein
MPLNRRYASIPDVHPRKPVWLPPTPPGQHDLAESHCEKAVALNPLNLSANELFVGGHSIGA